MSEDTKSADNPEAIGETSPYDELLRGSDTHEEDLRHRIRDRGRVAFMLFLVLAGSVYGNLYQLTQAKVIPYIFQVDAQGEVVTRLLRKPSEIPADDPLRHALIKNYLERWIKNARVRSLDAKLTVEGINSAIRMAAGPAQVKLSSAVAQEDVFARIKRETVNVNVPKSPILLAGNTWEAEWEEEIVSAGNVVMRRETWSGTFEVAEQPNWATDKNPLGIRVVNWTASPMSR